MNLGIFEDHLLPVVRAAVASRARAHAGPPVRIATTGMKFDVWVHAIRFEDRDGLTGEGARTSRRPVTVAGGLRGYAEERPATIHIEISCTGPTHPGVQELCGLLPAVVLPALETMPPPELGITSRAGVRLRFDDFLATVARTESTHVIVDSARYFEGKVSFRLHGFLHVLVARRGGLTRHPHPEPAGPALVLRVVQGPRRSGAAGEHVLLTNVGAEPVQLEGYVLHDGAPRRPHRFVFPTLELAPGSSVRVWTGKGDDGAEDLYWGRSKPVWNDTGDLASLLSPAGERIVRAGDPGRLGGHREG